MPFSKILLPMAPEEPDASMHALEVARELLREGGEIHTLTVLEVPPGYLKGYLTDAQITELAEKHREARRETPKGMASNKVVKGHPAQAILEEAEALGADCIVLAAHSPGAQSFLLGSTSARVVRRANCSVMVVRQGTI